MAQNYMFLSLNLKEVNSCLGLSKSGASLIQTAFVRHCLPVGSNTSLPSPFSTRTECISPTKPTEPTKPTNQPPSGKTHLDETASRDEIPIVLPHNKLKVKM